MNGNILGRLYKDRLTLATDLYQLTMAHAYWQTGASGKEAVFHLFFRKNPFQGGFSVACGLSYALDYLNNFRFEPSDLDYLAGLLGNDGKPLFEGGFLKHLRGMQFACDIDAVPEGTVVFPYEPMIRVKGPIIQCQILETPLLNMLNFQTLIATKAARICMATRGEPVLEFGLRRAQGFDGAVAASWAAHVGGCASTSNVLAGKLLGIPVKGTHAHSWVMSFDTELEAFLAYAQAMPNNSVFLVDTYDTLQGVRHAVRVGKWLRQRGHEMIGIRLDSGDLAHLSVEARKILDAGGFPKAAIVASNDLDEGVIQSLKEQGATINVWGVGTKLVTAYDQPALGGVYKLSAVRRPGKPWQYKVKLSEQAVKVSNPGVLQVRRFRNRREFLGDMIFNEAGGKPGNTFVDPMDSTRRKKFSAGTDFLDLLKPLFRAGRQAALAPSLADIRKYAQEQLAGFHAGVKRFVNPHQYPVGLDEGLHQLKTRLILKARGGKDRNPVS